MRFGYIGRRTASGSRLLIPGVDQATAGLLPGYCRAMAGVWMGYGRVWMGLDESWKVKAYSGMIPVRDGAVRPVTARRFLPSPPCSDQAAARRSAGSGADSLVGKNASRPLLARIPVAFNANVWHNGHD